MDYEEYKRKALEPIVNYIESVMASYSKEELEARIKKALPEKESEDERMVRIIENVICTNEGEVIAQKYGLKLTDLADWLEKQKEQPTNEEMLRTLRTEYEKGVADTIAEQKEQKPAAFSCGHENGTEWSEEDSNTCNNIITRLETLIQYERECVYRAYVEKEIKWLKERLPLLKPKQEIAAVIDNQLWKPSEEQMEALEKTVHLSNFGCDADRRNALLSLCSDLKKLM